MIDAIKIIQEELKANWKRLLFVGFLFALAFQAFMLLALIVRFQNIPNYVHFYDWIGNVSHIVQSTPSWADIGSIVVEEWLVEIGYMNYEYGMGLSIWSLNILPSRIIVLTIMGGLVALCFRLLRRQPCSTSTQKSSFAALSGGSILVVMTNATMSWVVCCATPSWVVGLAMLGLGVSTSLALESMGPVLSIGGFSLLLFTCLLLAWRSTQAETTLSGELDHA